MRLYFSLYSNYWQDDEPKKLKWRGRRKSGLKQVKIQKSTWKECIQLKKNCHHSWCSQPSTFWTQVRMLPHEPHCPIIKLLVSCLLKCNSIQACLILCDFFLCDFAFTQLESLHLFFNLDNNFWFNTIWHRWSVASKHLLYEDSRKWHHCQVVSHVYGVIISVT
jgi:hypothetical protein